MLSTILELLSILFGVMDAVLFLAMAIRFGRRVWRKTREPAFGLLSHKVFLLWTWFVSLLWMSMIVIAILLYFLTRDIWLSVGALASGSAIAVFAWLMWAIVPVIKESVRKALEP